MQSNQLTQAIGFHTVGVENRNSSANSFIEANTELINMRELRDEHIIPVFSATNEPLISHHEFVDTVATEVQNWFATEKVLLPSVRVSHPLNFYFTKLSSMYKNIIRATCFIWCN